MLQLVEGHEVICTIVRQGATLDDYFNFGFNEQSWREYAAKQVALRLRSLQESETQQIMQIESQGESEP